MLTLRFGRFLAITLLVAGFALLSLAKSSRSPQEPAAPASQNEYVTSATCSACHEDLSKKFARNPHQVLETNPKKGWKDQSCESCHGPGQAHVDAGDGSKILTFVDRPAKEINQSCLACHARMETHAGGGTTCTAKTSWHAVIATASMSPRRPCICSRINLTSSACAVTKKWRQPSPSLSGTD